MPSALRVVFQVVSGARIRSGRILLRSSDTKSLRGRVIPLSLVQFRLGTTQQVRFKNRVPYHADEYLEQLLTGNKERAHGHV